MVIDRHLQLL